jgi:signal transduction histidine kinase
VSHDLRTPLASILALAENLESGRVQEPDRVAQYHSSIRREAMRLRRLVDDVLDFSRIERGKGVHLSMGDVDVLAFARELEAEARERVEGADGELACTVNGIPRHIVADADALRRATMNLVDNALRHSGSVDVELELRSDGREGLAIQVRDRGRGVPAGRLESLFRPFERLEPAAGVAGTGLGLAIVREIAEGHGGCATAHLPDGSGLVFEIRIPAEPGMERA